MILRLRDRTLDLSEPVLMGIVNATPDSFSDPQGPKEPADLVQTALAQVEAGAAIIDVGGESGRTDTVVVPVEEEAARVVPVVERLAAAGVTVSVDTWRAPVARASLEAGAMMINDVSGLSDTGVAGACAETGAALVITHTQAPPKTKAFPAYDDVVREVEAFLDERVELAAHAVSEGLVDAITPGCGSLRLGECSYSPSDAPGDVWRRLVAAAWLLRWPCWPPSPLRCAPPALGTSGTRTVPGC